MKLTREIDIARPLGDVFAYVCDESKLPEWRDGLESAERVGAPGPNGGGRAKEVLRTPLGAQTTTVDITIDPPGRLVFTVVEGMVKPIITLSFTPAGAGTHLVFAMEASTGFGPIAMITESYLKTTADKTVAKLKERLEAA
jgi:carbon monoxide dehydrogenase subunit G